MLKFSESGFIRLEMGAWIGARGGGIAEGLIDGLLFAEAKQVFSRDQDSFGFHFSVQGFSVDAIFEGNFLSGF
jgi:hypothetical protein